MNFPILWQLFLIFILAVAQNPLTLIAVSPAPISPFSMPQDRPQKIHPLSILEVEHFFAQLHQVSKPRIRRDPKQEKVTFETIVDPRDQIPDFDARFEMAKILSHHPESTKEALKHYKILRRQKPNEPKLLLEIGRTYTSLGDFNRALFFLSKRLGKELPISSFSPPLAKKEKRSQVQESIVPPSDQIDEDHARLELARLLSHFDPLLDEAVEQYQILLSKYPQEVELLLELSRLYIRQKKYYEALSLLYPAIERNPNHAELLVEAAHAEHALKHAQKSQDLFLRALPFAKHPENVLLDYAETLMMVGSFYKAEDIYRNALKSNPNSLDLHLKLAWNFVSAQRYEEAEGMYRQLLLQDPHHPKILEALALLKILEKDFSTALDILNSLLTTYPKNPDYLSLRASAFYQDGDFDEALKDFEELASYPKYSLQAFIGMGRTYQRLCLHEEARNSFQEAYDQDPSFIEAQFYLAGQEVIESAFIAQVIDQTSKPEDLEKWANIYAENGMIITELYEAALKLDPDYFPAQIGLAEALSAHYHYDDSIELYLSLLDAFPCNSKIMIAIARVLSWGKQYQCSFNWYDRIIEMRPENPLPRREKARVAYWGYFFDYSMSIYQELLRPTVDELFLESLNELNQQLCDSTLANGIDLISQSITNGSIYTGYETFATFFTEFNEKIDSCHHRKIEEILIQYLPLYRIQKSASLESYAKELDWKNYYLHALPIYQELATFSPGNEEGLYGYAQDYCSLGLCRCSRRLYYHILNISANHSFVKMALERNLLREHWLVQSNYTYWKERGRGQFSQSQIARHQFDEIAEWSPACDFHLRFMQHIWLEHPYITHSHYYPAEGQTIEVDRVFSGSIKGSAGATRKNYFQRFVSRYTGFATVWFDVNDYFNLGLGFERRNEIYNYFSLKEGIQAKVYWASMTSNLTHYWTMATTYRHYDYNDKNTLDHVEVLTSYVFSDDPNVFKIIFAGSYRNTAHLTKTILNAKGRIVNVIHPYWTPQNYYSNSITLEYRHNYSFFNYCEGPLRYIDIKLTGEEDTARNPSFQIAFEWKHEFMYHFGFELKALIHQSKLWNAEGAWLNVYYRF